LVCSVFAIRTLGEPKAFLGIEAALRGPSASASSARRLIWWRRRGCVGALWVVQGSADDVAGTWRAALPSQAMADIVACHSSVGSLLHLAQCRHHRVLPLWLGRMRWTARRRPLSITDAQRRVAQHYHSLQQRAPLRIGTTLATSQLPSAESMLLRSQSYTNFRPTQRWLWCVHR
jgi:hypothetical protein